MIELRDYQEANRGKGLDILKRLGLVYLAMEVRTGKTLTALAIARDYGAKRVLCLTKIKAIASIKADYEALNPGYELTVINDESLHKVEGEFDLLIRDEQHRSGAFPKPGVITKELKRRFAKIPHIYLSGTPAPEGWSQIYHQFWISAHTPFAEPSFYKWAQKYVQVTEKWVGSFKVKDYTRARQNLIESVIAPYMVRTTQTQAGFESQIQEHIIKVPMQPRTAKLAAILQRDAFVQGGVHSITADTAVALQQKLHQIWSGTVIVDTDEGQPTKAIVIDPSKAEYIRDHWAGQKVGIFYCFTAELEALQQVMGDRLTTDIDEFNATDKSIALQVVSGREGVNLSKAAALVFYNIAFSATSYWQARDRMTTKDRTESQVYWLFSVGGIEEKIYDAVRQKKNYTLDIFRKDFGIKNPKRLNQAA